MNKTSKVKKFEKNFVATIYNITSIVKNFFISFFRFFVDAGKQRLTIMLIPHSEKKVFNFRINIFLLSITMLITIGCGIFLFILSYQNNRIKGNFEKVSESNQEIEARSREYKDLLGNILDEHHTFNSKLELLLSKLNSPSIKAMQELYGEGSGGPHNPLESPSVSVSEFEENDYNKEVKDLLQDYRYAAQAFNEINRMTNNYNKVIKDLPFGNPVKGIFIITSQFGFRIHPIHKVLDMHQGIDLANRPGTRIVATAPGIVEKVEYNPNGYGWYVKISHKLGFSTLYAHMQSRPLVNAGDKVSKGEVIGYMGSTGASTSSHLHYEVRLGNNLLDPWSFISIY
ncbi:MAG: M23 family metallopeptidase [Spirochaetes bacterium]|nr:M23 family metallopeptidase [Spirochaetota bacterium]